LGKSIPGLLFLLLLVLIFPAYSIAAQCYVRGSGGFDWPADSNFHDEDCHSKNPAALFGCGHGSDGRRLGAYGDFRDFSVFEAAAGLQPLKWLRTDVAIMYRPEMKYKGEANFLNVPGKQPVSADAYAWTGMVNIFMEIANLLHLDTGIFSPYVGGGAGISYNHTGRITYRFPGLTRHKISITPSGSNTDFAYMLAAGTGVQLSKKVLLDISYRYSDLGQVETDNGNMYMDSLPQGIDIAETSAPLRTHGFLLGLRYLF
jgi:opacity protein-like surface antigen